MWAADDGVAEVPEGGVGGPEGAQDGGGGGDFAGLVNVFVCDFVDESWGCQYKSSSLEEDRLETYDSTPRTSEMRCASFLVFVVVWPMELTNRTPSNHSSFVSSTSRMKSCRCVISLLMTRRVRSGTLGPMALMTASVKLGSKRCFAFALSWYCGADCVFGSMICVV